MKTGSRVTFLAFLTLAYGLEVMDLLPCLFEESSQETAQCIVEAADPECFNSTSLSDIQECLDTSSETSMKDKVIGCTADYMECVNSTIKTAIESMPACVNSTMTALGQCAIANAETCSSSCVNTVPPDYSSLTILDVATCDGIQSNVLDPACSTASCCPDCLDEMELLAECVVNDVLGYTVRDCDFTCTARRRHHTRRGRQLDGDNNHHSDSVDAEVIYEECIAKVPGIYGPQTQQELVDHAGFFQCVMEEYLEVIDKSAAGITKGQSVNDGGSGDGGSGGGSGGDATDNASTKTTSGGPPSNNETLLKIVMILMLLISLF